MYDILNILAPHVCFPIFQCFVDHYQKLKNRLDVIKNRTQGMEFSCWVTFAVVVESVWQPVDYEWSNSCLERIQWQHECLCDMFAVQHSIVQSPVHSE
jgi:hypothetical protein